MSFREWRETELQDVSTEIIVGYVGTMTNEYIQKGIPFLRSQNVEPFNISMEGLKYISTEFHTKIKKSRLSPGDVVIVRTGKPGICSVIPEKLKDANCSDLVIVRPSEELDPFFLAYYVNSVAIGHINAHLVGAVQQHFNVSSAKKLKIKLPELNEQKVISATLSCLDDKIELNNRMNKNLEEMAKAIFKSWFVDFEPFQEGEFEESELGLIPKGWRVRKLGEFIEVINGYSYKGSDLEPSKDAMLTIKNFDRNKGFKLDGFKELLITERVKDRHFVDEFDVLIACTDLTQNAEIIGNSILLYTKQHYNKIVASMDLVKVKSKDENIDSFVIHSILNDEGFKQYALGYTSGTTVLHLDKKSIGEYLIIVPNDLCYMKDFSNIIQPLYLLIKENIESTSNLKKIRDTLLPKLMSGEIRVPYEEVI